MIRRPDRGPARRRRRPEGDAGITIIELVVTMSLMSVFLVMFTGALIQIHGTVNRSEAIADAQSQVTRAVARLDKELRYAAEISAPGTTGSGGRYTYVEYFSAHTGTARCSQLRLDRDTAQLKLRSWRLGTAPTSWTDIPVLVAHTSDIAFPAPRQPSGYQQLRVRLRSSSGGVAAASDKDTDVTFTALNSNSNRANTSVTACTAER